MTVKAMYTWHTSQHHSAQQDQSPSSQASQLAGMVSEEPQEDPGNISGHAQTSPSLRIKQSSAFIILAFHFSLKSFSETRSPHTLWLSMSTPQRC